MKPKNTKRPDSSWENSQKWYDKAVGEKGLYYHQEIILPGVLRLLDLKDEKHPKVLDLACGQGILTRHLPPNVDYVGVDLAPSLIDQAKKYSKGKANHRFLVADITRPLDLEPHSFTHAVIILALQNLADPFGAFQNCRELLKKNGKLIFVINHPCFRIPRQTSWQIDSPKKIQYRRIDRYYTSMEIPIQTHPSQDKNSPQTWSFHYPLAAFSHWLKESNFVIDSIEEWCSNKQSTGSAAAMENRSREEFPLFMAISARHL